jgi:hypothetical protein
VVLTALFAVTYVWLGIEAVLKNYGEQNGPVDPDPYWRNQE